MKEAKKAYVSRETYATGRLRLAQPIRATSRSPPCPHIFRALEEIAGGWPYVEGGVLCRPVGCADPFPVPGRDGDFSGAAQPCYAGGPLPAKNAPERSAPGSGGFLANHPLALVLFGCEAAIADAPAQRKPFFMFSLNTALIFRLVPPVCRPLILSRKTSTISNRIATSRISAAVKRT